jgi:hypothetical protein
VGKQNQGEPVGFRVDPVCQALHRSYSGMSSTRLSSWAAACAPGPASRTQARTSPR